MLAGGFNQSTNDLRALYQTEQTRQHARDWLTERSDYQWRHDRWIESRDLFLEIVIILLIGWEIRLSYQQEKQQAANFVEQQKVLTNMLTSSQTTAEISKTLSGDQKLSLAAQTTASSNLQSNLTQTGKMATALQQQLLILQNEQAERVTEQNRRPELELWVQSQGDIGPSSFKVNANTPPFVGVSRQTGSNLVGVTIYIRNVGNTPAVNVIVTPRTPSGIVVECLDLPWLGLYSPKLNYETCQNSLAQIPPILPRPKDRQFDSGDFAGSVFDPAFDVVGSVAYTRSIDDGTFTGKDGSKTHLVVRTTDVLRKSNGKWRIVQEHVSFPVDPTTGKADLLSKP